MTQTSAKNSNLERLALEVATGQTVRDAADALDIAESTAYHLSCTPAFKSRVNEIRSAVALAAVSKLASAAALAVNTLIGLLAESQEPNTRLNAAKAILANLAPMADHFEMRQRISELEAQAQQETSKAAA